VITISEFSKEFFLKRRAMVLSRELSPASYRTDEWRISKVIPKLGELRLGQVTALVIDRFLDSLIVDGKSPASRNRYRALLHSLFEYAIYTERIKVNPVRKIRILSEKLKVRKTGYWENWKDITRYIKAAFAKGEVFGLMAAILCLGGCRIGEALALDWEDIDWKKGHVRIRKIVERPTFLICDRTKGQRAGGEYQMLLLPQLKKILLRHRKVGPIFLTPNGQRLRYETYRKTHYKIIKDADLKRLTPHDLRRTFATHAERAGFHRSEVGEMLGHETLAATAAYVQKDVRHLVEKAKRVRFGK
jgi:integrase